MNDWFGPESATFGDRLAAARESAGMTQVQLAKRLGVKINTLRGWENDLSEPRANRLQMVAGLLNVSIVWLLTGDGGDGVSAPEDSTDLPADVSSLLTEIRDMRTNMRLQADRLGRLEKALRSRLKEEMS